MSAFVPAPGDGLDLPTLTASPEAKAAAVAAGLGNAWTASEALERVAEVVLRRWPSKSASSLLSFSLSRPSAPTGLGVDLFSWVSPSSTATPAQIAAEHAQEREAVAALREELAPLMVSLCPLGQAELCRVERLAAQAGYPLLSPQQWRDWPDQHRDPTLAAWLSQAQLSEAFPAPLVSSRPRV